MHATASNIFATATSRRPPATLPEQRRAWGLRTALALLSVFVGGLIARECAYRVTGPVRFELNQRNAFYWGDRIVRGARASDRIGAVPLPALWRSYVDLYEDAERNPPPPANTLDYAPLRLLMAAAWVDYLNWAYGPAMEWRPEFARSFSAFSMVMELAAAAAMFAVVARWLKRAGAPESSGGAGHWRRHQWAAAASALVWLNPASIIDSHVWPHGQTWILPFYLLAVLAMIQRRFVAAGVCLAIGAMFKGQMLLVAPAIILWPAFQRRGWASLRVLAGLMLGVAAIASPWLARGSMAWAQAGFTARGIYSDVLRKGTALNLPALLGKWHMSLHQRLIDQTWFGQHLTLEVGSALAVLYLLLLLCCAWGMARHASAGSPRLLAAIAAPWAVMFFVLGQMDERYLVWAACFSAGAFAVRWWALAAHAILTWAGATTMLEFLLINSPDASPGMLHVLVALNPLTWLVTAAAVAALLYASLAGSKRPVTPAGMPWGE